MGDNHCRKCGSTVCANQKFCVYCGNPVEQHAAQEPIFEEKPVEEGGVLVSENQAIRVDTGGEIETSVTQQSGNPLSEKWKKQCLKWGKALMKKKVANVPFIAIVGVAVVALFGAGVLFSSCNTEKKDPNAPSVSTNSTENESNGQEPNIAQPTNRQIGPGALNANRPQEPLSDPNLNSAATLNDIYGFWEGTTKITDVIITPSAEEVYEDIQYHQLKYGVLAGQDIYEKSLEEIRQDFEELRGKIGTEAYCSFLIEKDEEKSRDGIHVDGHWVFHNSWDVYRVQSGEMPNYKDGMDERTFEAELDRLEKEEGMSFSDAWDQLNMGNKVIELQNGGWRIEHNGNAEGRFFEIYFDGIVLNEAGKPALKGRLVGTYKYPLAYMGPAQDFSELLELGAEADKDYTYLTVSEVHEFHFTDYQRAEYSDTTTGNSAEGNESASVSAGGNAPSGAVATNTGTAANSTQSIANDGIVGQWEAVATVYYWNELDKPGTLELTWEQKTISDAAITHVAGDTYTLSLTTKQILGEGEPLDDYLIRQGQVDYEAILTGDTLTFSLESDNYALADIFDDGIFRPLTIQVPLKQEGNTMAGIVNTSQETTLRGHPIKTEVIFEMKKQN